MKSAFLAISSFLLIAAVHGSAVLEARTQGDYVQDASGDASFTSYSGCGTPGKLHLGMSSKARMTLSATITPAACGQGAASGYTAAMNLLSFGAPQGSGPGDACGRCFSITGTTDPNTGTQGTFGTIVVKVTDLCTDGTYCDQTLSNPINSLNQPIQCVKFSLFSLVPVLKSLYCFAASRCVRTRVPLEHSCRRRVTL